MNFWCIQIQSESPLILNQKYDLHVQEDFSAMPHKRDNEALCQLAYIMLMVTLKCILQMHVLVREFIGKSSTLLE